MDAGRLHVDEQNQGISASSPYDPFQPEEYERLRRQSLRDAVWLGADPSVGEDALHNVYESVIKGNPNPLSSPKYFRTYVISRIRDLNRADRRILSGGPRTNPDGELDARREEALRRVLPRLLEELAEEERAAVCAQIHGWLADHELGEEEVRAFERHWRIDLGPHSGTAQLAASNGTSKGTVAPRAHRAKEKMRQRVEQLGKKPRSRK